MQKVSMKDPEKNINDPLDPKATASSSGGAAAILKNITCA